MWFETLLNCSKRASIKTKVAELATGTASHPMLTTSDGGKAVVTHGLTLGIGAILSAATVMVRGV